MKQVNQNKLTLVVSLLSKGLNLSQISKKLKVSKAYISKVIRPLKAKGAIIKKGYGVWEVNNKLTNLSLRLRDGKPQVNLHALQIKFPILEGEIKDKTWKVKNKLNNWIPKYKNLIVLGGLTLRNNNNKSITVFTKSRGIKDWTLEEIDVLARKIQVYIPQFFLKEYGMILDNINCKTSNLNIATEDKHSESMQRKGEKFELKFDKYAEKIFPQDKIKSKAWIDGSPFKFSAETNDKNWKREYLRMPFTIRDLTQLNLNFNHNLELYNKNIVLHLKVLKKIGKAIERLGK